VTRWIVPHVSDVQLLCAGGGQQLVQGWPPAVVCRYAAVVHRTAGSVHCTQGKARCQVPEQQTLVLHGCGVGAVQRMMMQ
jgi:hypothetical protein